MNVKDWILSHKGLFTLVIGSILAILVMVNPDLFGILVAFLLVATFFAGMIYIFLILMEEGL